MGIFDDSQSPYRDTFDANKAYEKVLFRPGRPVFQSELNELQSMFKDQIKLFGNSLHKEGDILSGMSMIPQGAVKPSKNPGVADGNANLISYSTLAAYNSRIDTRGFAQDGQVSVYTKATQEKNYPGLQFNVTGVTAADFTLRFKIKRTSGTLYKISTIYDNTLTPIRYQVDGSNIKTPVASNDTQALIDSTGSQLDITDGNDHEVLITFKTQGKGTFALTILANAGYNALTDGQVTFDISELKAENGDTATGWSLAPGDVSISDGSSRNQVMRVTDGQIYLHGMVCYFYQQDINITGFGKEVIGVRLDEDVITSDQDRSLVDATVGARSQWQKGADRLHYTVSLTYNDSSATPIYILKDGKLNVDVTKPDSEVLNDILAKRTNDESGSYRVFGFNMWSETNKEDSSKVNVVVDAGTAYVQGYQIIKQAATRIPIDKATSISRSGNESYYYSSTNDDNGILDNQPVKQVDRVTAGVQVNDERMNRNSNTTDGDALNNSQVYKIIRVYSQVADKVVDYTEGVDFRLQDGHRLVWDFSNNGKQPVQGGTYYVTYQYTQVMERGKDYEEIVTGTEDSQITKISFANMKGRKPAENTLVSVDYQYFLAREDLISLDKHGDFSVVAGQPAPLSTVQPPLQQDPLTLRIGYVRVFPNSSKAQVFLDTVTRIPFTGLQDMEKRINNVEYNLAQDELHNAAMANQDPVTLADVFSDDFSDIQKGDIGNKDFTAAYDVASSEITLANRASTAINPDYDQSASSIHKFMHMVTAPFSEYAIVSQAVATGVTNINPYQNYNVLGTLSIDPAADSWINQDDHTLYNDVNKSVQMGRWWFHNNTDTYSGQTGDEIRNKYHITDGQDWSGWTNKIQADEAPRKTGYNVVDKVIEYGRPRTISFKASNFEPLIDNLELTIDGYRLNVTPKPGYAEGTTKGTIRSATNGVAEGTFDIPPQTVRTGVREVKLSNGTSQASTIYTINGTQRDTYTTITRTHTTINLYDPVAQSFVVHQDTVLTGVKVYFATKASSDTDGHRSAVTLQIRNTNTAGYPTNEVKAEVTLQPSEINVSSDASVATEFTFEDPVLMSPSDNYVFALITDSNAYNIYIAQNGQRRLDNNSILQGQAYAEGAMFSSSYASAWTTEQNKDLKFDVMAAKFAPTGTIMFETVYPRNKVYTDSKGKPILDAQGQPLIMDMDKLLLMATYLTPDNTGLQWDIKLVTVDQPNNVTVNDVPWQPINNFVDVDLLSHARELKLRATFAAQESISPILALDDLVLVSFLTNLDGTYISRTIDMSAAPYNYLKLEYQAATPEGSWVEAYWSSDGGNKWNKMTPSKTRSINKDYIAYTCEALIHDQHAGDMALENSIKFMIHLVTKEGFIKPRVRRLTSTMHETDNSH